MIKLYIVKTALVNFILIISSTVIYSQIICENCNPKSITTNFTSPLNNEKPSRANTFFDWTYLGNLNVFSSNFPAPYNNIASPFHQDNNAPLAHFFDNPDRLSKDGWELIKYNLGYLENGSPNGLANRDIYIVLYNKFTAILRVFVASNESIGYNGVKVKVDFISGSRTSLLSNASEIFALDKFKPTPTITGVIGYRPALWSYADFNMTYDACTCKNESKLKIGISYISTSTLKLNGAINGTIVTTGTNGNLSQVNQDGYSFADLGSGAQKAKKTYDDFQGFVNDQFNAIDNEGKTNYQIKAEELLRKNAINSFQQEIKQSNFLKNGLKALPYIGAAVDLLDFFIGGGKQSAGPLEVKIMPLTLQADVTLSGEINIVNDYPDIIFNTPGSKNVPCKDDAQYPYYNEVLGVFNLLETPKIYYTNLRNDSYYDESAGTYEDYRLDAYQVAPIKYLVNPAAGFRTDNVDIMASIDFGNFKTAYVPLSALNSFRVESGYDQVSYYYNVLGCMDSPTSQISLRLLINLERLNADANTQNVLIAIKYPLNLVSVSSIASVPAYCDYLDKVSLSNRTVSYNISAWEEIIIGSDVTFSGNVKLRAPKITIQPGVVIPPNVTLESGLPNGHIPYQIQPVSQSEISTFCASSTYNTPLRNVRKASDETQPKTNPSIEQGQDFRFYPNPTSDRLNLVYKIDESAYSKITIINLSGKIIATPLDQFMESGTHQLVIDTSELSAGIYAIKFETGRMSKVEKLIINK